MTSPRTRLERSTLFVPASQSDMVDKASRSAADAVCLDLEDSIPADRKAAARHSARHALDTLDFGRRTTMVRINALDTGLAYRDLVEIVEAAGDRIDLVMVPKVGAPRDIEFVDTLLSQIETHHGITKRVGIEAQIETAAGFLYVREIARASSRLEALVFGPGDYAASMHMPSAGIGELDSHDTLYPGHRWHAVMHAIVAAARANGLRCIDGPYARFRDAEGLDRACHVSRAMGFDGKQCIHPGQIDTVNRVFSPTDADVAAATDLVRAYEKALPTGTGASSHDARMIDAASLRMAQTVLEQRRLIEPSE